MEFAEPRAPAGSRVHHDASRYPNNVIETITANSYMPQAHTLAKRTRYIIT